MLISPVWFFQLAMAFRREKKYMKLSIKGQYPKKHLQKKNLTYLKVVMALEFSFESALTMNLIYEEKNIKLIKEVELLTFEY